jgi:hypothetical protein
MTAPNAKKLQRGQFCKWWLRLSVGAEPESFGQCRRRSPVKNNGRSSLGDAQWPLTPSNCWCGEWQAQDEGE